MSHLTLSTFGTLRVALDGTPITSFATDKVRALLVFLAVAATHPHRRETLAHAPLARPPAQGGAASPRWAGDLVTVGHHMVPLYLVLIGQPAQAA
jgi:hypothetical protein